MGIQVNQVNKALQDLQGSGVYLERKGRLGHLVPLVLQDQQVTEENRGLLECMASRVCLDQQAQLEREGNQVIRVFMVREALWDHLDQGESVELQEREGSLGLLDCKDPRVSLEHLDQTGQREVPGLLVLLVIWVLQVFKECLEKGESLALLVLKVIEVQ